MVGHHPDCGKIRARTLSRNSNIISEIQLPYLFTSQTSPSKMDMPTLQRLAPPGGHDTSRFPCIYIAVALFQNRARTASKRRRVLLHTLLCASLLMCYWRTCFTDPGQIPKDWQEKLVSDDGSSRDAQVSQRQRWCRKCESFKPPRAHHCKTCKRYVLCSRLPRMDLSSVRSVI